MVVVLSTRIVDGQVHDGRLVDSNDGDVVLATAYQSSAQEVVGHGTRVIAWRDAVRDGKCLGLDEVLRRRVGRHEEAEAVRSRRERSVIEIEFRSGTQLTQDKQARAAVPTSLRRKL